MPELATSVACILCNAGKCWCMLISNMRKHKAIFQDYRQLDGQTEPLVIEAIHWYERAALLAAELACCSFKQSAQFTSMPLVNTFQYTTIHYITTQYNILLPSEMANGLPVTPPL